MHIKRFTIGYALLVITAALALTGCAPRIGTAEDGAATGANDLVVDLPTLVIAFDSQGNANAGDVPLAQLVDTIAPGALNAPLLDADTVDFLTASNIQHVQMVNRADGLNISINGLEIPSPAWDSDSLQATAVLAAAIGLDVPGLDTLISMASQFDVGVIATFPTAAGAAPIPIQAEAGGANAATVRQTQTAYLNEVQTPPLIGIPVDVNQDGTWTIGGMSAAEWSMLIGGDLSGMRLPSNLIQTAADAGISQISIATDIDGIHIGIDGRPLPYLRWADGRLHNLIDLLQQMGMLDSMSEGGANSEVLPLVQSWLAVLQTANANITFNLP